MNSSKTKGTVFAGPVGEWKESDDASLIACIEENPTLWDSSREDFRDNKKKHLIYMHIASRYPRSTPNQIEKRFYSLKEKLRREKRKEDAHRKSGSNAKYKKWPLMSKLKFLEMRMSPWKKISTDSGIASDEITSFSPVKHFKLCPGLSEPSSSFTQSTSETDTQCIVDSSSPRTYKAVKEAFMEQATETMRQIGESLESISAQSKQEKENHYKVFEYLAQECSEMEPLVRNIFVREVMELFWKYKLD